MVELRRKPIVSEMEPRIFLEVLFNIMILNI